jgi:maltose/maltodextrin transport system permease protein
VSATLPPETPPPAVRLGALRRAHDAGAWRIVRWLAAAALALTLLFLVFSVYASGETVWALGLLVLSATGFAVYLSRSGIAWRYLFPGVAGMLLFVAFPLLYTMQIGFTNYSSNNLLSLDRARAYLLEQTAPDEGRTLGYTLHADGGEYRLVLSPLQDDEANADPASDPATLVSPPLALRSASPPEVTEMVPLAQGSFHLNAPLDLKALLSHRDVLMRLKLKLPDGRLLSYAGVREFGPVNPLWQANADGSMTLRETGAVYRPNMDTGFFEGPDGAQLQPGFKVNIGAGNYVRMFSDPGFRGPFFAIFGWTLLFALLTVLFSLVIGMTLAVVLNWEALRFRTLYRTLLFLPYAVPGFISILVFKGLFNQNFGEINAILDAAFGVKPAWFADPLLAKAMLLIVNTWLGYPYIMVLCSGLIKAIPADLYEASAIAGARPLTNFFKITAPLIVKPLMPLLIAAFAYNFNNFVLVALLTDGRPDFLNTKIPAGTTDILVSYTYRIAFKDSGQNFGLAAAISTMIFFMVALMSLANLHIARVNKDMK